MKSVPLANEKPDPIALARNWKPREQSGHGANGDSAAMRLPIEPRTQGPRKCEHEFV